MKWTGRLRLPYSVLAWGLALLLLLSPPPSPARAQGGEEEVPLFGRVVAFQEGSLTVRTRSGEEVVVQVPEGTPIRLAGAGEADPSALLPGRRVALTALSTPQGLRAVRILVLPEVPIRRVLHIGGVVLEVEGRTARVLEPAGVVEVQLPEDVDLSPGQITSLVVVRDPEGGLRVRRALLLEELLARVKGFKALDLLERARSLLEEALEKAPEEIRAPLEQVRSLLKQVREGAGRVPGEVVEVEAGRAVIRLTTGEEVEVQVPPTAPPLRPGARVAVEQEDGRVRVRVLPRVWEPRIPLLPEFLRLTRTGTLKAVLPEERVLLVERAGEVVRIPLAEGAPILLQGKGPVNLEALSPGMTITVVLDRETERAVRVMARPSRPIPPPPNVEPLTGVLLEAELEAGQIRVRTPAGEVLTLALPPKTPVEIDGEEASLEELRPGLILLPASRFRTDRKAVLRLALLSPEEAEATGEVVHLERAEEGLRLTVLTPSGRRLSLTVDPETPGLQRGARVRLRVVPGEKAEVEVVAVAPPARPFRGPVVAVDPEGRTLQVRDERAGLLELSVPEDTPILLRGDRLSLEELAERVPAPARGRFRTDTRELVRLELLPREPVRTPVLGVARGILREVDPEARTLTLATPGLQEETFRVDEEADIRRNGRPAGLEDLAQGDRVLLHFRPQDRRAFLIRATAPPREGLAPTRPRAVMLRGLVQEVEEDELRVEGREVRLTEETRVEGELRPGARVRVWVEQRDEDLVALRVEVLPPPQGPRGRGPSPAPPPRPTPPKDKEEAEVEAEVELEGVVAALEGNRLLLQDGTALLLTPETRLEGTLRVGARVEVKARPSPDGSLIALRVEVEREAEENRPRTPLRPGRP